MNLSRILHTFCLARLWRLELLILLWSSGATCVIVTVSLTPSLSMIILCNKQTVLIIVSTCSGLTCNSVFRHLHFATSSLFQMRILLYVALYSVYSYIFLFVEALCHYPWDISSSDILLMDIPHHLLTHVVNYFCCYTVHVVEILNYYTNHCTYIKFIKFTH